jgi:hypothetical protein
MGNQWETITTPDVDLVGTCSGELLQGGSTGVAASGTITFKGTVNAGTMMIIEVGDLYVPYKPATAATMTAVALGAAAAINAHVDAGALFLATSALGVLTITTLATGEDQNTTHLGIAVGGEGTIRAVTRRQIAQVDVHVWAYDNASRELVSNLIDDGLSQVAWIADVDLSGIRLDYKATITSDAEVKHGVYHRVLRYTVEYVRTKTVTTYSVLEPLTTIAVDENP